MGKFHKEAQQWFIATRMNAIPQNNHTRLMEIILDQMIYSRGMMKPRKKEPLRHFFGAMDISGIGVYLSFKTIQY